MIERQTSRGVFSGKKPRVNVKRVIIYGKRGELFPVRVIRMTLGIWNGFDKAHRKKKRDLTKYTYGEKKLYSSRTSTEDLGALVWANNG